MDKYKCTLCLRNFANGRALGGHMRSHNKIPYVPLKPKIQYQFQEEEEEEEEEKNDHQLSEEMESQPSSSSSSSEDEEEEEEGEENEIEIRNRGGLIMCKGKRFREKQQRKRNYLVDPEFSSQVDATAASVVLQDRESETESSKKAICRRSKRIRKSRISDTRGSFSGYNNITESPPSLPPLQQQQNVFEKQGKSPIGSPLVEHEPVSSISDTTPEEDVAYCLMMLSRDKWNEEEEEESELREKEINKDRGGCDYESGGGANAINKVSKTSRNRGKFKCETCYRVFRSYQALGGHRASHKRTKVKSSSAAQEESASMANACSAVVVVTEEKKIHECPVCYRVFSSGQALGGHKRSHFIGGGTAAAAATATTAVNILSIQSKPFSRFGENLIDLNLPAPMDDDDDDEISQIELSAVSDAEFDNPINRQ